MKLEWRNIWMHGETWQPMDATNEDEAARFLQSKMPHTEDGTQIRNVVTGQVLNWTPPRETIHWGP